MALTVQSSPSPPSFCVISDGIKVYKDKIRRTAGGSLPGKGKIIKSIKYCVLGTCVDYTMCLQLMILDHQTPQLLHQFPANTKPSSRAQLKRKAFINKHQGLRITYIV